ncbi:RNA polymerase ECF-type sigma factor [Fulvivirga imtechensis AK7]|uniref:RNA polymerase ECF-type sigma factor n=1 Tax=Fulvivirga imtechensis AK7 TaxID=1237149 RepID=L8JUH4_9BACT|nr:sigma-70 family RNA polymerase sigma factor [Fulvivirga imtechensis]ELR71204.1 RNA polymerase ECF-type sigma factor [Fulvivirga imtechensis AK7]
MDSLDKDKAFVDLIERNKGIIYKVANSYCTDTEERKDLVQEMIIQLWRSFANYDSQYKISTWMYRIALNVAISYYRKERKTPSSPITSTIINIPAGEEQSEREENIKWLYHFINELDELNRALMLLYLDDSSYKEMAEVLGISETNVATKIGRIKKKLKQQFSLINE